MFYTKIWTINRQLEILNLKLLFESKIMIGSNLNV